MNNNNNNIKGVINMTKRNRDEFVFFWGGLLSNFSSVPGGFKYDGKTFANSEQLFMYLKAVEFNDTEIAEAILKETNPKAVKKLGRKVRNFDETRWSKVRYSRMLTACLAKFSQSEKHKTYLLNTGERWLVEASPYDRIFGIGLAADHPDATDPDKWRGENLLGQVLMDVRDQLRR